MMNIPSSLVCVSCHAGLPPGSKFCLHCGAPTAEPAAATTAARKADPRTAERRYVTASFCDLVGSTELSSTIDAEEFSELIHAYHECAVAAAGRYDGKVDHYAGDGINLVFGWPHAHDDDAERAVRCSLEIIADMRDRVATSRELSVRLGVHTGVVIVGEMGASAHRSVMALGETMNVAARLQNRAEPGSVIVSDATLSALGGAFETSSIGMCELKGIAKPLEAHVVHRWVGVESRFDRADGRLTPFVGRTTELSAMTDLWSRTVAGEGSAVLISGEPGVGKSRLAHQLRHSIAGTDHLWLTCGASSYTQGSVLRPAIDLLIGGLGVDRDDDAETRSDKIVRGLAAAGLAGEEAEAIEAMLQSSDGRSPIDGEHGNRERRSRRTTEALCRWIVALARMRPVVLVVEDLHWCDDVTLQLLDEIAVLCPTVPLLLLTTARPEFTGWSRASVQRIELAPVTAVESLEMITTLAGGRELPAVIVDKILSDTGGIPLFVEEICKTALESGDLVADAGRWTLAAPTVNMQIPTSLRSSLLARLDRLGTAKATAQVAAVIGREFSFDLLVGISDESPDELSDALSTLIEGGLVLEDRSQARTRYTFRHVLVQEAAYDSLLHRDKRTMHKRIAERLIDVGGVGTTVAHEVIARHYDAGGEVDEAVRYYRLAGYEAAERGGCREAMRHLRRGIELLEELPSTPERDAREIELQMALGSAIMNAFGYADPNMAAAYERARHLCEANGDVVGAAQAITGLSIHRTNIGELELGAELGEQVLAIAAATNDDALMLLGLVELAHPRLYQSRADETLAHAERALAIYDRTRHRQLVLQFGTDHGVAAHMFAGWARVLKADVDQALQQLDQAIILANELDQPLDIVYALFFKSTVLWVRGDEAESVTFAAAARQLGHEYGFNFLTSLSKIFELSGAICISRDASLVPELLETSFACLAYGNKGASPSLMARVAEAVRATGDLGTANAILDAAFAVSAETRQPFWDCELHRLRAELTMEASEPTAETLAIVQAGLEHAVDLSVQYGFLLHELRARTSLVRFLARDGRHQRAAAELAEAHARCTEGWDTPFIAEAKHLLAEVHV